MTALYLVWSGLLPGKVLHSVCPHCAWLWCSWLWSLQLSWLLSVVRWVGFFLSFLIPFSIFLSNVVIHLTVSQEVKTKTVGWAHSPMSDHNQNWLNQGVPRSYFEPLSFWLASCFWKVFHQKAWHGCNTFNTGMFVKKTKQNKTRSQTLCTVMLQVSMYTLIYEESLLTFALNSLDLILNSPGI